MQSNPNIDFDFFDEDDNGGAQNNRPKSSTNRRRSSARNNESAEPERNVVHIEATVPQVTASDNYSDNFESSDEDGEKSGRKSKSESTTEKRVRDREPDSGSDGEQAQTREARPKTGVKNRRQRPSNGDSGKISNDDDGSSSGTMSDSDSYSSGSDITDVSPLNSPSSPKSSRRHIEFGDTTTLGENGKPKSGRPLSGKSSRSNYQQLLQPNRDTMNLKLLMQAISEMERDGPARTKVAKRSSFSGKTTRQFVAPADRKNFSFRNSQIRDIDKENQRLMQQIMRYSTAVKKQKNVVKTSPVAAAESNRPTTSSVNRMKEQRRIDEENRAMLRRLEQTRATDTLQRQTLIQGFNTHTVAGVPMGAMHPLPSTKVSPYRHHGADTNLRSHSTSSLTGRRSRPQSAKLASRPGSAKVPTRPQSAKAGGGGSGRARPPSAKLGRANSLEGRPAWQE